MEILTRAVRLLSKWGGEAERTKAVPGEELTRAIAELQGQSGLLVRWQTSEPLRPIEARKFREVFAGMSRPQWLIPERAQLWRRVFAAGFDARARFDDPVIPAKEDRTEARVWMAATDLSVPEATAVQFLASSSGQLQVWLDGERIYQRDEASTFQPDSDRFDATLDAGLHRLVMQITGSWTGPEFQVRFRRKNSSAELEQLSQAALARQGDAARGRKLFFDAEKVQCSKCHRIGDEGERIGPELTGVGDRFSRIHIVESILEPSRTVATGYQTIGVLLRDGRVLSGIKVAESETLMTLGDNQGKKHDLAKADIDEQAAQTQSTMPEGLVKQITVDQFVDLITFLVSQKGTGQRAGQPTPP
jgi:putative heme-binding domain-containing protein